MAEGYIVKEPEPSKWPARLRGVREVLLSIGAITFLFAGSIWLIISSPIADPPDVSASAGSLLLSAASLALLIFTSFVAIVGVFTWQGLLRHIDDRIKTHSSRRYSEIESLATGMLVATRKEILGRFLSVTGFTIAELTMSERGFNPRDSDLLEEAVEHCRLGYELLKDAGEGPSLMSLNNYVYYLAIQEEPENGGFLLENARRLREASLKHRKPNLSLTFFRVVACYSSDETERTLAENSLRKLLERTPSQLSRREGKEARHCLSLFKDKSLPFSQNGPT